MERLEENWITQGLVDFEYKKYILLAYLQHISHKFDEQKLYPELADLIQHYRNLQQLKNSQEQIRNNFPKKLTHLDLKNFLAHYELTMNEEEYMEEISLILEYGLPRMEKKVKDGKEIYENIEHRLAFEPIGIEPLQKDWGYLFIKNGQEKQTQVYAYTLSIFESMKEKYRSVKTVFIDQYNLSISQSFEHIKLELIRVNKELPNPATYLISSNISLPYRESLLPIAKRKLMAYLGQ